VISDISLGNDPNADAGVEVLKGAFLVHSDLPLGDEKVKLTFVAGPVNDD